MDATSAGLQKCYHNLNKIPYSWIKYTILVEPESFHFQHHY